jgi:hypothetical protein
MACAGSYETETSEENGAGVDSLTVKFEEISKEECDSDDWPVTLK